MSRGRSFLSGRAVSVPGKQSTTARTTASHRQFVWLQQFCDTCVYGVTPQPSSTRYPHEAAETHASNAFSGRLPCGAMHKPRAQRLLYCRLCPDLSLLLSNGWSRVKSPLVDSARVAGVTEHHVGAVWRKRHDHRVTTSDHISLSAYINGYPDYARQIPKLNCAQPTILTFSRRLDDWHFTRGRSSLTRGKHPRVLKAIDAPIMRNSGTYRASPSSFI